MPTLYQLKPAFQSLLRPIAAGLASVGVTANQVTIGTALVSVLLGFAIAVMHRGWILLPIFLFLRMALNAIDGLLAREYGQKSHLGAVLNELGDVIADAALVVPVATLPEWDPLAVAGAIFFAALAEFAGVLGPLVGGARRNDGPFGKSDRAFALGFLGAWIALGLPLNSAVVRVAPFAWMLLCCVTVVQRVRRALG